jgi:hypothetical protein
VAVSVALVASSLCADAGGLAPTLQEMVFEFVATGADAQYSSDEIAMVKELQLLSYTLLWQRLGAAKAYFTWLSLSSFDLQRMTKKGADWSAVSTSGGVIGGGVIGGGVTASASADGIREFAGRSRAPLDASRLESVSGATAPDPSPSRITLSPPSGLGNNRVAPAEQGLASVTATLASVTELGGDAV